MKIALTVDLERDVITDTFYGIKYGLPEILSIFDSEKVQATFFTTGEIVKKFPNLIKEISIKHEIGIHGSYDHKRLNKVNDEIILEIMNVKKYTEDLIGKKVYGFRAPYLDIDLKLLLKLKDLGFIYDSSIGTYRMNHYKMINYIDKDFEFIVMFPNVFFRFPMGDKIFPWLFRRSKDEIKIFYLHPWEAINVRGLAKQLRPDYNFFYYLARLDRWINTGKPFLNRLKKIIKNLKKEGYEIKPLKDYVKEK